MAPTVLVAYASRHGSTKAIAERIAVTLTHAGVEATALPCEDVRDVDGYDGYVIGSAVYAFHWLGEARSFVKRHRPTLQRHPVWLFSSGPLGTDVDAAKDAGPRGIDDLVRELGAREHRMFAGAYDASAAPIGVLEHVMKVMPSGREALPSGDFRDWTEIDAFARAVAGELELALVTS